MNAFIENMPWVVETNGFLNFKISFSGFFDAGLSLIIFLLLKK
jgi:hypothetical protein